MIKRRALLGFIGLCAFPARALAQDKSRVWRVGFLAIPARPVPFERSRHAAFVRGMRALGYVEGENLEIAWRFADGDADRLPALAAELVALKPDVLVVAGTPAVAALQNATRTIPIVIATASDPVGSGFVQSLGRPGGNITGLSNISTDLSPKLLEMLLKIYPRLSRLAVLVNPSNKSHGPVAESLDAAAKRANLEIVTVQAAAAPEIEKAFAELRRQEAAAVIVAADAFFIQQGPQIAGLALKHRVGSVFPFREQVDAGGLMSYGQNLTDNYRRAANYVDRIFRGAKPADLPVEQSTTLELFINRKTANALGLTIPADLLLLADELIE